MGVYANSSDVSARLPYRTIDATTKPSIGQVDQWVLEAESILTGAMNAAGITTPITNANGKAILRSWATDYAEARYRMGLAAAGGDGQNDDGEKQLEQFTKCVDDILNNPTRASAMLNAGAVGANALRMRGRVNVDADRKFSVDTDLV